MDSTLLTISEFASFSGVPRKTLIFYDNQNILKPAKKTDKGYRFYEKNQIYLLQSIKLLQALDYSLADIVSILDKEVKWDYEELLDSQLKVIAKKKVQLDKWERMIYHQKELFSSSMPDLDFPIIREETVPIKFSPLKTYNPKKMRLSETFHIFSKHYSPDFFLEDNRAMIYTSNGTWNFSFFNSGKVVEQLRKDCVVVFSDKISYSQDVFNSLENTFKESLNVLVEKKFFIELFFTNNRPVNSRSFIYKFTFPIHEKLKN
ncbi:MerR family transcriptional regulator [Enterococcus sp. LJL120]